MKMSAKSVVYGRLDLQCRIDGAPSHEASGEDPMECEQCGVVLGRHVDLLSSQVPHVRRLADEFSSLSVSGLRQQVVGALVLCKHALQTAVTFNSDMQRADDALLDFSDLFEFRERVSAALNVLAAVESLVQRRLDTIGACDDERSEQHGSQHALHGEHESSGGNAIIPIIVIDD